MCVDQLVLYLGIFGCSEHYLFFPALMWVEPQTVTRDGELVSHVPELNYLSNPCQDPKGLTYFVLVLGLPTSNVSFRIALLHYV